MADGTRPVVAAEELDFDLEALREKYRASSGTAVCAGTAAPSTSRSKGRFAHYLDDPYADPTFTREPIAEETEVVDYRRRLRRPARRRRACARPASMTSGSSRRPAISAAPGTGTAIQARPAIPRATSTCRCSRSSATSRRPNTPRRRRSCEHCRAHRRGTSTSTTAPASRPSSPRCGWDEAASRWIVTTDRGDRFAARFVIMAGGTTLGRPKLPGVPGIDELQRPYLPHQPLGLRLHRRRLPGQPDRLSDKRVGIIGTGATAVQCVPHLGRVGQGSFTSSSARLPRSTYATTVRPIRSGPRASSRAGTRRGSTISPP